MIKCNLCGSNQWNFLFTKSGFDIVKCRSCGLIYMYNTLTFKQLKKYYIKGYYNGENEFVYKNYEGEHKSRYNTALLKIKEIESIINRGKILDIGCAMGFFLEAARDNGWETYGVELSQYAYNYAKNILNLKVQNCDLTQTKFPDNFFDVVTMWDVIEHLPDPQNNLKKIFRILKKGGLLIITTGDVLNLNARIFKKKWIVYAPPWHLYYFSRKTLKNILKKTGFIIDKMTNSGIPFCNSNTLENRPLIHKIFINRYTTFITNFLNIGDVITVYARK